MKNIIVGIIRRLYGVIPAVALLLASQSVVSTCCFWFYQPNIPEEILQQKS